MGQVASELLAPALVQEPSEPPPVTWKTWNAGRSRVDLEDKDALWRLLDEPPAESRG